MIRLLTILFLALATVANAQPRIVTATATRPTTAAPTQSLFRANPIDISVKLDATRPTLTGVESLNVEIRLSVTDTTTALARTTVNNPTGAGPFTLSLTGAQMNQDLGGKDSKSFWLVVYTLDDAGETLDVLWTAPMSLKEHGASLTSPAPPNVVGVATAAQLATETAARIAADNLLATQAALAAESAARQAADSLMGTRWGAEGFDDFSLSPNGAPTALQSGQPYLLNGTHGATAAVTAGRLVATAPGNPIATYIQAETPRPGKRVGAKFSFSSGSTTGGGAATIGFWKLPMDNNTGTLPEDCPAHFVVSPVSWSFGVWSGGSQTVLATAFWATPLTADDATLYTAEVYVDQLAGVAYISVTAPDGSILLQRKLSHALISSVPGNYAFIEHFRSLSTDTLPQFSEWWWDASNSQKIEDAKKFAAMPSGFASMRYGANPASTYTAPTGSNTDIDATNVALPFVPTSAKALVRIQVFYKFFLPTDLWLYVRIATSSFGQVKVVDMDTRGVSLASASSIGATSFSTSSKPVPGIYLIDPTLTTVESFHILSTSGTSAPYTANLANPATFAHASAAKFWPSHPHLLDRVCSAEFEVTGLSPGSPVTLKAGHLATVANAAVAQADSAQGNYIHISAVSF